MLSKLDDELIETVVEEQLDNEVKQADMIKEKTVMDTDQAFERPEVADTTATGGDLSHRITKLLLACCRTPYSTTGVLPTQLLLG